MSSFYKATKYNGQTLNQMWMSMIADSHDIHCHCELPFAHLLDSIFPEGHKDRDLTIKQIVERDLKTCHFGGEEEKDLGMALGSSAANINISPRKEGEEEDTKEDIEELLAAATAAEER